MSPVFLYPALNNAFTILVETPGEKMQVHLTAGRKYLLAGLLVIRQRRKPGNVRDEIRAAINGESISQFIGISPALRRRLVRKLPQRARLLPAFCFWSSHFCFRPGPHGLKPGARNI